MVFSALSAHEQLGRVLNTAPKGGMEYGRCHTN